MVKRQSRVHKVNLFGAEHIGKAVDSVVKPTVDLFGGKKAQTPGAINVDIGKINLPHFFLFFLQK